MRQMKLQSRIQFVLPALAVSLMISTANAGVNGSVIPGESGFDGAVSIDEHWSDGKSGYVTVTIPYLDMRGETARGQARLYFKHDLFQQGVRPPVYCSAYYPLGQAAAMKFCDLGYVVVTPHDAKFPRTLPIGTRHSHCHPKATSPAFAERD